MHMQPIGLSLTFAVALTADVTGSGSLPRRDCSAEGSRACTELTVTGTGISGDRGSVQCLDELPRLVDTGELGATVVLRAADMEGTTEALKLHLALQELGFEDIRMEATGDGWTLYPAASPGIELAACPQR